MTYKQAVRHTRRTSADLPLIPTPTLSEIGIIPKIVRTKPETVVDRRKRVERERNRDEALTRWALSKVLAVKPATGHTVEVIYKKQYNPVSYYTPEVEGDTGDTMQITRTIGGKPEVIRVEVRKGSCYFDVAIDPSETIHGKDGKEYVEISNLADRVSLPHNLTNNEFDSYYQSPEYIDAQMTQAGIPTHRLQTNQSLVWVMSRQDHNLYIFRQKDLANNGKMAQYGYRSKFAKTGTRIFPIRINAREVDFRCEWPITFQGPQTPRFIPSNYFPNEIWTWTSMPSGPYSRLIRRNGKLVRTAPSKPSFTDKPAQWIQVGTLSNEQSLALTNLGPPVQSGKLEIVPLFDRDQMEDWDGSDLSPYEIPEADYNGPITAVNE